ncbi:MAG: hypothetical protein IPP15_20370 [Saprospiraceae bacterium]|uniref:CRISPR type III-associated protein domain-containing protein n=1 Tax=Candidatus Opimibacter skivensis TaxID=2982028 RepID=A0A9D7XS56_9BACT|nr:hypothetical protein [Candidatus Opimibacter skivensis]
MNKQYIYLARVILEAETVLSVGSGDSDGLVDDLVTLDHLGLPCIPGTAIAGCLTKLPVLKAISGGPDTLNDDANHFASSFITSDAYLIGPGHVRAQSIADCKQYPFFNDFFSLPIRDHVRINHRGVADTKKWGKFDDQVVYKGARFICELEIQSKEANELVWLELLEFLKNHFLILGSGSRKGYGRLSCIEYYTRVYDLGNISDFNKYLDHSTELILPDESIWSKISLPQQQRINGFHLVDKVLLQSDDALHFGSGQIDFEVDLNGEVVIDTDAGVKTEKCIIWDDNNKPVWKDYFLLAGTSIKGTIAHRFIYYNLCIEDILKEYVKDFPDDLTMITNPEEFNKFLKKLESESIDPISLFEQKKEEIIIEVFGGAKDNNSEGRIGKVIVDDIYIPIDLFTKKDTMIHNSIDRFSGGTIDGALFNETNISPEMGINFSVHFDQSLQVSQIDQIKAIFEEVKDGKIPLGGKTTKGYGQFKNTLNAT